MAAGEVDDGEAAHAETGAVGDVESLIVGAAVHDLLAHVVHESFSDVALASRAHHSGNSTHGSFFFPFNFSFNYPFNLTGTELDISAGSGRSAIRLKR